MKSSSLLPLLAFAWSFKHPLMAQEKMAPAVSPAGSSRPAGVPADYVITPFGFFHPSCVLQAQEGRKPSKRRRPSVSGWQHRTSPDLRASSYKQSGELAPGSSDADKTAVVQELDTTPPPAVNGWVENSNASIGTAFGKVVSTWTVPALPLAHDAQTVYFFPGLETSLESNRYSSAGFRVDQRRSMELRQLGLLPREYSRGEFRDYRQSRRHAYRNDSDDMHRWNHKLLNMERHQSGSDHESEHGVTWHSQ